MKAHLAYLGITHIHPRTCYAAAIPRVLAAASPPVLSRRRPPSRSQRAVPGGSTPYRRGGWGYCPGHRHATTHHDPQTGSVFVDPPDGMAGSNSRAGWGAFSKLVAYLRRWQSVDIEEGGVGPPAFGQSVWSTFGGLQKG